MPALSILTFLPQAIEYLRSARPTVIPGWSPDKAYTVKPLAQGEYSMNFTVRQGAVIWVLRVNRSACRMPIKLRMNIKHWNCCAQPASPPPPIFWMIPLPHSHTAFSGWTTSPVSAWTITVTWRAPPG
jgi:hypothetical protein